MKRVILFAFMVGCTGDDLSAPTASSFDQATTVCGVGPTVKGIDVSYHQGTINWSSVKSAGVQFAFIRVSDGSTFLDPKFDSYWASSRAVGIKHGAYQFFRPAQDPIVQADILLNAIGGALAPDDLPPVVDVEAADGVSAGTIQTNLHKWIDRVTAKIGRAPIIYTGYYFWRDSVGDPDFTTSPLWHAQYTSDPCPKIDDNWPTWHFWQYTEHGSISGISGDTDIDRWNGDRASLDEFIGAGGSTAGICGDATCDVGESKIICPEDCGPCGTIAAAGGTIDDGDACFEQGGPVDTMRHVTSAGQGGDLVWTHTTNHAAEVNYATWNLFFDKAGRYKVEVYTDTAYAQSRTATYVIDAGASTDDKIIDQTTTNGWQTLGEFDFVSGGHQSVHLGDNTGEPGTANVQLVFDAVRLTPAAGGSGSGSGSGSGKGDDGGGDDDPGDPGGCAVGGNLGFALIAALAGLRRRRRG